MRSASFLSLLVVAGCGGEPPAPADAGLDAGERDGGSQPVDAGPLCASDEGCDNGLFCDGVGRCLPGDPAADARGCVVTQPCQPGEICEEGLALCRPDTCEDQDDDTFTTCEGDCDDLRNDVNPGRMESCIPGDPTDEDCNPRTFGFLDVDGDGEADMECYNVDRATGMRYAGTDCNDAIRTINSSAVEICDGVVDHDCDETPDQEEPNCPCIPDGGTRPCGSSSTGICRLGLSTCTSAGWSDCVGNIEPLPAELCNGGPDDDCDGTSDEGCACTVTDTQSCGRGACAGTSTCIPPGVWGPCNGASPTTERCDGIDSDCDGTDDASDEDVVGAGDTCGNNVGICRSGTQSCAGSMLVCGGPGHVPPGTETCNHLDDDCDSNVDDSVGAAMCAITIPTAARTCFPGSVCTSGVLGAPTSNPTSNGVGTAPAAVYSSWRGDLGRASTFRTQVWIGAHRANNGFGYVSLVVTPDRNPSSVEDLFYPSGLPALTGSQKGLAVALQIGRSAGRLFLYALGTGNPILLSTSASAAACASQVPATRFSLEIQITAPSVTARLSNATTGCSITASATLPSGGVDFWRDLYGETPTYPTYYFGVVGDDDDGDLVVERATLELTRGALAGMDRNNCIGCL